MPVAFADPHLLLLLPLLLVGVWLVGRRSLAGLDRGRRRLALGLRLMVVSLLVLALAEIEWRDLTEKVEVIFVVDHSRSVPEEQVQAALDVVNAAQAEMDARVDLGKVVVFGRDAATEVSRLAPDRPGLERFSSLIARDHTDLELALRQALEALEQDARGRIVLLSDGNPTLGDASAAVARARAAQVPIDVVPLEYSYDDEVLVEKLVLPSEIRHGEPFAARVVVDAVAPTRARINLFRNGAVIESREVDLEAGANVAEFQVTVEDPGFSRIYAVVEPLDRARDALFQNNTAHGFVFVRGKAQVLYVHSEEDPQATESHHLLAALEAEKVRCTVISAAEFPLEPLELQSYDAIILDDVARPSFSERQQLAIESAVGDMGVGLIMIGGERSFGPGEWRGSPVEAALPVEMDIKQEEVIPDGALVMILHSCEFPDGNAMAIKVCKKAVDGLSAKDTVGLLHYGMGGNEWGVPLQQARNKAAIKRTIHGLDPGDMPDFDGIFRMALQDLKKVTASVKHMILLSDGDPSPPSPALLAECKKNRITVSTICYFAHGGAQGPNVQVMRRIANMTGGKFYYLEDEKALPRIFLKESQRVARSLIVNQTFVPRKRTESTILTGIDELPPVTGYVLTEAKPRAEVALVSPENAPVLAQWQYGVGKAVAFTSDAKPRWATAWVEWGGFRSFWAQTVRWVSKDVQESHFAVTTRIKGDKGVVVLDAVTPEGEVLDGLSVTARITPPDEGGEAVSREVRLVQRGAGRYEGEFPVDEVGTYNVHLLTTEDGELRHSVTTGLVYPYSDEFKRLRSDRPYLQELARQGSGRVIAPQDVLDGEVDLWDRESLGQKVALVERWPLALTLALLLFLLDVAARRVAIDTGKLWTRARGLVASGGGGQAPPRTMDRLRERKAAVREEAPRPAAPAAPGRKFEPSGADHGPVDVAGGPSTGAPRVQARPRPQQPGGAQAPQTEGGSPFSRLREAKKRARQGYQEPPQGGDEDTRE